MVLGALGTNPGNTLVCLWELGKFPKCLCVTRTVDIGIIIFRVIHTHLLYLECCICITVFLDRRLHYSQYLTPTLGDLGKDSTVLCNIRTIAISTNFLKLTGINQLGKKLLAFHLPRPILASGKISLTPCSHPVGLSRVQFISLRPGTGAVGVKNLTPVALSCRTWERAHQCHTILEPQLFVPQASVLLRGWCGSSLCVS